MQRFRIVVAGTLVSAMTLVTSQVAAASPAGTPTQQSSAFCTTAQSLQSEIQSLAALAALMPIVASIGGNTGNQTVALVIRALALDQLGYQHRQLVRKELTVSLVNGLMWGTITGVLAFALYPQGALRDSEPAVKASIQEVVR